MAFRKIPEGDKGLNHVNSWRKRDVRRGITITKVLACSRNKNETRALEGSGQGRLDIVGEESIREGPISRGLAGHSKEFGFPCRRYRMLLQGFGGLTYFLTGSRGLLH